MAEKKHKPSRSPISDARLKSMLEAEIKQFRRRGIEEWDLFLKWQEIQKWLPTQSQKNIQWVKRLIWTPKGLSDYRRLEPELIYVKSEVEYQKTNIWGEKRTAALEPNDPLADHWAILRKLVSTARDTGGGGMRMLKFLVRDKVSKKYLGVICISSDFMDFKGREKAIGWNNQDFTKPTGKLFGKLNNTAQGQAIVPTQPFGNAYNGTKLLALLCLSDVVARKWEEVYGDKLVLVTTTALWGMKKNLSSYDGLEPYWMRLENTSGSTPIKFTDDVYENIRLWAQFRYPERYAEFQKGRDSKNRMTAFVMKELGVPPSDRTSKAIRLAYMSRLYKNTDDFLKGEIGSDRLALAFDNSVASLTRFWKFGIRGDTTKKLTKAAKKQLRMDHNPLPQDITLNLAASAKTRIDSAHKDTKDHNAIASDEEKRLVIDLSNSTEWYEDLANLTWNKARKRFLSQVGR